MYGHQRRGKNTIIIIIITFNERVRKPVSCPGFNTHPRGGGRALLEKGLNAHCKKKTALGAEKRTKTEER
jgi:hypothetical protein